MSGAAAILALLLAASASDVPAACAAPETHAARWEAAVLSDLEFSAVVETDAPVFAEALLGRIDPSASPAERAKIAGERLRTLCAGIDAWTEGTAPGVEPDPARLQAILERPEFAGATRRKGNALESFLRRFTEALERLFGAKGSERFASGSRLLVLSLALVVLVGGVLRVVTLRRARRSTQAEESQGVAGLGVVLAHPDVHRTRALQALTDDPRGAIREGLLALISALERQRWARPDRVKTNRELARELPERGAPPELAEDVARVIDWYDQTFYSLEPVATEEARRFLDEALAIEGRIPRATGGAA